MTTDLAPDAVLYQFPRDKEAMNILGILIICVFLFGGYVIFLLMFAPTLWNFWVWASGLIIVALLAFFLSVLSVDADYRIRIWKDWMQVEGRQFDPRRVRWILFHRVVDGNRPGAHCVIRFILFDIRGREQQATVHVGMYPSEFYRMVEDISGAIPNAEVVRQWNEWAWL